MESEPRLPRQPRLIPIACILIFVSIAFGLIRILIVFTDWDRYQTDYLLINFAFLATFWTFSLLLPFIIMAGRNWARIAFLIIVVSGFLIFAFEIDHTVRQSLWDAILGVVQGVFQIVAAVLLFISSSERWFDAMKAHHKMSGAASAARDSATAQ